MNEQITTEQDTLKYSCNSCGAYLKYKPDTQHLNCEYCGAENEIEISDHEIEELDYNLYLTGDAVKKVQVAEHFVKCESCTTTITLNTTISSAFCPYCSTPLIIGKAFQENVIQPKSILPFKLDVNPAKEEFKKWINGLWFAPNNLNKLLNVDNFKGIYIPYWTYDTLTINRYTGERGTYYYVSESYTTTEGGRSVTKTRKVRKTRWRSVSGTVRVSFNDLLVTATRSLSEKHIKDLEPWDMENLVPFDKSYLSGYITEKYQVNLQEGFDVAKKMLDDDVRIVIGRNIGGDEQRINTLNTSYLNVKFKHILLPVYVSAYNYNDKLYQFFINARTGEVQGERPYSWIKITLTIIMVLAVIGLLIYLFKYYNN